MRRWLPKTVVHSSKGWSIPQRKIRRDDGRAAFVTLAEYFEEKLRAGLRERHIAEFVDDEQFDGGELRLNLRMARRMGQRHEDLARPGET
jgi:hypothetical protein